MSILVDGNTVVIGAATQRLVHGLFECEDLGPQDWTRVDANAHLHRLREAGARLLQRGDNL